MPGSARSTERLIEEWQAGRNRDAVFQALFERYYPAVTAFFRRRGSSPAESDDLIQETFLRAYRGMNSFRHESRFEVWLFAIARSVLLSAVRRVKRRAPEIATQEAISTAETIAEGEAGKAGDAEIGPLDSSISPEEEALGRERVDLLRVALEKLPSQMRRCMEFRVYQDLKYREIAEVLGVSIQTVKSHLSQAKARLKEELGDRFPDVDID